MERRWGGGYGNGVKVEGLDGSGVEDVEGDMFGDEEGGMGEG